MSAVILLLDPKFPHNVGRALRAASCFGALGVYWTGERVSLNVGKGERLPREERMKAYRETKLEHLPFEKPVDFLMDLYSGVTPVVVETVPNSEEMPMFIHPEDALYIFGPEDGSVDSGIRHAAHRFVRIPSFHCLDLSSACYVTLYDRMLKRGDRMPVLQSRGWYTSLLD